jgi:hypothetical protein
MLRPNEDDHMMRLSFSLAAAALLSTSALAAPPSGLKGRAVAGVEARATLAQ